MVELRGRKIAETTAAQAGSRLVWVRAVNSLASADPPAVHTLELPERSFGFHNYCNPDIAPAEVGPIYRIDLLLSIEGERFPVEVDLQMDSLSAA